MRRERTELGARRRTLLALLTATLRRAYRVDATATFDDLLHEIDARQSTIEKKSS